MTRFKGMPLFGPDSSPLYTSTVLAAIGTFSLSLIFFVVVMVVKPAKKEHEFREVQIVFKPEPKDEYEDIAFTASFYDPAESELEDSDSEVPLESGLNVPFDESSSELIYREQSGMTGSVTNTDKADKSKPSYKRQSAPKVSEQHTSNNIDSARSENRYAADPMDAYKQQTSKKKVEDYDWDAMFADDSNAVETTQTVGHKVNSDNKMSGSAGKVSDNSQGGIYSQNKSQKKDINTEVNEKTKGAIEDVLNAKGKGKKGNNGDSESDKPKKGGNTISLGDGTKISIYGEGGSRLPRYISPISLSDTAIASITDNIPSIKVEFTILENGVVGNIQFEQGSYIPEKVRNEIKAQVSKWQFSDAPDQCQAHFTYKIINK